MSKSTLEITVQRVIYETDLPVSDVLSRLDNELNKERAKELLPVLSPASSKKAIDDKVSELTGGGDFIFFNSIAHNGWLDAYWGTEDTPVTQVYTLGNPSIAQTMLKYDLTGALYIPPKLLVLQKSDRTGTKVVYDLPSSLIAPGDRGELKEAAERLDGKMESLVRKVTEK